jgi:hypothetical protein
MECGDSQVQRKQKANLRRYDLFDRINYFFGLLTDYR